MVRQIHVYVIGDVIGVGFRAWTKIQAKELHLHGWVRNVFDNEVVFGPHGGVEAVFQGTEHHLNAMIERIKRGPPVARVDDVEVYWQDAKTIYSDFSIRK